MIIILNSEVDQVFNKKKDFINVGIQDFNIPTELIYRADKILLFENLDTANCRAKFLKSKNVMSGMILTDKDWENFSLCGNDTGICNPKAIHYLGSVQ